MKNKEIFLTSFFVLTSLFIYSIFPVGNNFQIVFTMLVFFVFFPFLFNKLFLKRKLGFYGIKIGDWKQGLIWGIPSLIIIGIILFILSHYYNFLNNYSVPVFIVKSFSNFLMYEFFLVLLFVFIYEVYFRGFIFFIFEGKLKYWAILIQAILFLILVLSISGSALYLFFPYLIFTPFAGLVAYKSRSILYSGLLQFILIFILDIFVIKMLG